MREKVIERKLIQAVRQCGGLALKFVSPGFNGVPDRLLLFMGGKVAFVEVKAPGESPRPLQAHRMEQLRRLGFKVFVLDSVNQIEGIISSVIPTDPHVIPAEVEGSPPRVIPRFETPGERASGSFSAENGRQPRGKALQAIDFPDENASAFVPALPVRIDAFLQGIRAGESYEECDDAGGRGDQDHGRGAGTER